MAGKVFTDEEKELLSKNPYVESVEPTRIIYTDEFKIYYVKIIWKEKTDGNFHFSRF